VDVDPGTFSANVKAMDKAINSNTIALVGSAPGFPQGIIDPISELSALAVKHKLGLHVDCCLGSFLVPFAEKAGYKLPLFDFRLPGVTSISCDTHKYGYAPKGTSVILYRSFELRHNQYFVSPQWMGGIYCSPSMPGSRPGGLVVATWAAMVAMGEDGYVNCAKAILNSAREIKSGINQIDGVRVLGDPAVSVIAFGIDPNSQKAKNLNIYKVGEAMGKRQWNLNTLQYPSSIHICCTYMHREKAQVFLSDLKESIEEVQQYPERFKSGMAAVYGLAESIPDGSIITDMTKGYIDILYKA